MARLGGFMNKHEEYEQRKQNLLWAARGVPRNLTSEEYEEECKKIAKEIGI